MILLDAYALVALFADEPAASDVQEVMRQDESAITSVNLAEALDVARRVHGAAPGLVRAGLDALLGGPLVVWAMDAQDGENAAELRVRYYARRRLEVSLADCFLLAAGTRGDGVATSDPGVAEVARAEAIPLFPLPDSNGRRP